ncbi:MAG: hypothetical protein K2G44_05150 [Clostridia bacterium]|nr:hypothetical protein [Clostridia bacterium]
MFRIWAKVMQEDHIAKQFVYTREEPFAYAKFFDYLTDICGELDIPTPVLLKPHIFNYAKFNHVIFRQSDFMELPAFDKLILENIL